LAGALVAAGAGREPDGRRLRTLTLLTGLAVVATALSPVVAGAFVGLALSGFLSIWLIAAASTLVLLRSEPRLRGRIAGIWTMALPGSYPVSGLLIALVSTVSPRAGFSLAGLAMVTVAPATRIKPAARLGRASRGGRLPASFGTSLIGTDDPRTLDETRSGHGT
jgi:MFS family permease